MIKIRKLESHIETASLVTKQRFELHSTLQVTSADRNVIILTYIKI